MSDEGWRHFLATDAVEDWVVLHGGATAAFRVGSLAEAARLAGAVAGVSGVADAGVVLTVTDRHLTVRLTRDLWLLEPRHADLAHAISEAAHAQGATADRSVVHEVQVAIAAHQEALDVDFWRAVLGYSPASDDNAVDPLGHGSTVWMQELEEGKPLRHAMHLDVSLPRGLVGGRVAAALAAGGRIVDASPPEHWTLADRAGNRVCVCAWPDGGSTGLASD